MAFSADKLRQGASGNREDYSINKSLRFNDGDGAYLSRTPSSAGNRKTWTWSGWVKRSKLGTNQGIFSAGSSTSDIAQINWQTDDSLRVWTEVGGVVRCRGATDAVFRDVATHYHILWRYDATVPETSLYINGVEVDVTYDTGIVSADTVMSSTVNHDLGRRSDGHASTYLDGYLTEVHFIDGQALTPSSFGETDATYGHWKPKRVTGMTYGTNGFYLPFDNTGTKHTLTANGDAQHSTSQSKIGSSSIAFDGSGDYLSYSDSEVVSADFTYECFFKRNSGSNPSTEEYLISNMSSSPSEGWYIYLQTDGRLYFGHREGGSEKYKGIMPPTDTSWHHIALVRYNGTFTFYIDGNSQSLVYNNMGTLRNSSSIGTTSTRTDIGNLNSVSGRDWNGYMDEIRISNTARYTSNFTPSTTAFTDDSNTLLLIHSDTTNGSTTFTDSSGVEAGLGNDQSGQANHWTSNNLASTDQMLDSPTNNFATLNSIDPDNDSTYSEGNLKAAFTGAGNGTCRSTIGVSSGKWYAELYAVVEGNGTGFGVVGKDVDLLAWPNIVDGALYISANGYKNIDGTETSFSASTWAENDIIGVALDMDAGTITVYKNNVSQGQMHSSLTGFQYIAFADGSGATAGTGVANFGQDATFAGNKSPSTTYTDGTYGDFYYEPPSGFKALCTANLDDPAVIPSKHFNTVTYTGDNTTPRTLTGVGFQPDWTWVKNRTSSSGHYLWDAVRGTDKNLRSDGTWDESAVSSASHGIVSTNASDGFVTKSGSSSSNNINNSAHTYVAWNWKANGSGSSNTDGSITSTVSANTAAGFSIVSYTANGSNTATVGHGLSQTAEMVITKRRDSSRNWHVGHKDLPFNSSSNSHNGYLSLNSTGANNPSNGGRANIPNATTFQGEGSNGSTMIAYCFHSVDGYSKVGSYTGNGSSDGPFVYTGFRPAYVLIKSASNSSPWAIWDSARDVDNLVVENIRANDSAVEYTSGSNVGDFTSNGFKIRGAGGDVNGASSYTYIYIAFAEFPFSVGGGIAR